MYKGKATCKILKEIRKQIAKENDIAFVTSECQYQGDCQGTCPACEAEVRFLEEELHKRRQLGKTALVTGVSLGLATSFLGCHFGGNTEDTATDSVSSSPAKQESNLSSTPIPEEESTSPASSKATQPMEILIMTTDGMVAYISDYYFAEPDDSQTSSSDTIDIIYEMPEYAEGDISVSRTMTLEYFQPSVKPGFPGGEDSCRQYIQQHFRISPNLKQYLRGKKISFNFTIEENGRIGHVDVHCDYDYKSQKSWAKRCERAVKKAIRSMPHWTPGKDQDNLPVRCVKSGHIIIGEPNQVLLL